MNCKNCNSNLKETDTFCAICGGKIIPNRLTIKSVLNEFFETVICWDNKLFKTVQYLFTNPKEVIVSYLNGVRKRYMPPFGFLIFAMTFYGLYMFFIKNHIAEYFSETMQIVAKKNHTTDMIKWQQKINTFILKYSNLIMFGMIPISAFFTKLIFKKFNFIEHVIIQLYINAQYILVTSVINTILFFLGFDFKNISYFTTIFMLIYYLYTFKNLFSLSIFKLLWKSILSIITILLFLMISGIIVSVIIVFFYKTR